MNKFFAGQYDLILLDVMLPKLDGIEVCQRIREKSNVPIIMLTAKGDDMDKILGLEYGADDYMTKPFNILEVKARIKTIFRRTAHERSEDSAQRDHHRARHDDQPEQPLGVIGGRPEVNLTAKEFDLLQLFVDQPRQGVFPGEPAGNHLEVRLSGRSAHRGRAHPPPEGEDRSACPASLNTSSPSGEWATISLTRIKITHSYSIRWKILHRLPADHLRGLFYVVAASLIQLVGDYHVSPSKLREEERAAENLGGRSWARRCSALRAGEPCFPWRQATAQQRWTEPRAGAWIRCGAVQADADGPAQRHAALKMRSGRRARRRRLTTAFATPRPRGANVRAGNASLPASSAMTGLYAAPGWYEGEQVHGRGGAASRMAQDMYDSLSSPAAAHAALRGRCWRRPRRSMHEHVRGDAPDRPSPIGEIERRSYRADEPRRSVRLRGQVPRGKTSSRGWRSAFNIDVRAPGKPGSRRSKPVRLQRLPRAQDPAEHDEDPDLETHAVSGSAATAGMAQGIPGRHQQGNRPAQLASSATC